MAVAYWSMFRSVHAIATCFIIVLLFGCSPQNIEHVASDNALLDSGQNAITRGKELVLGLGACGFCHGENPRPESPLIGGRPWYDVYGKNRASNLTPHSTGIGDLNNDALFRYFRYGLSLEGEELSQLPHRGMEWMADEDLLSIISYLRSLPARESKDRHAKPLTIVDRNTGGFFEGRRSVTGFVAAIPRRVPVRYGQYLVNHVAACGRCHNSPSGVLSGSEYLRGGEVIRSGEEERVAPDISADKENGIGSWNEDEIVRFLNSGNTPKGRTIDSRFCPVEFFARANDEEKQAVAKYLKSVVPE